MTGKIFWRPRIEPVSAKNVKVLSPRRVSQFLISSTALDPVEGGRSGKRKIIRASPTPSGYLVYKSKANTMTVMEWVVRGAQKRMSYAVSRQEDSIDDCAHSLERG